MTVSRKPIRLPFRIAAENLRFVAEKRIYCCLFKK